MIRPRADDLLTRLIASSEGQPVNYVVLQAMVEEASNASGAWLLGIVKASEIQINGVKVLGVQQPAIPNVSGGTTIDSEARNTLAQVLTSLRAHGIIAATG